MSYYLYILKSEKTGRFYIGQTAKLEERIKRHNAGRSQFTKTEKPWVLVYQEEFKTRSHVVQREKYLKSPKGWLELQKIKENVILRNVAQPG